MLKLTMTAIDQVEVKDPAGAEMPLKVYTVTDKLCNMVMHMGKCKGDVCGISTDRGSSRDLG